ncbi:NucA/NucB deoxyribonuclease domain-containing protein [Bacillus cereus]|uniref:NucA/NucB deoxyribonuclease domain-containing protein n=1 Tax=Bacillus cereus group TaxID=86661 RepID=UPI00101F8DE0|nr:MULTISPECIES: NucA/NucB deoxyribonuclease domain-containing protein [Bacillus cereus group]MCU5571080.1 NucA/NucB deoxyribonuclease domain-containing protein [Bacillus cereus]MDO6632792.1 NucA/NucB deoxyribonuclease domain-containing protein [Bacillus thuringiensis]MDO6662147.1 NucA/NucB deoxyribonuclease domain-containing protein [Bacillus thuringiensis]MDO6702987.1 NucA/NucB deoxyribonuclease domain-containing protein [Bacillus thuringiensis]
MKFGKIISSILVIVALIVGYKLDIVNFAAANGKTVGEVKEVLQLPSDRFPETAAHIKDAIKNGKTDICTIDRKGASERRKQSLANVPVKKGYDRDEYPMAFCKEGGTGADVRYISPSDNRGAGSYVGSKVSDLPDGTKFKIVVK